MGGFGSPGGGGGGGLGGPVGILEYLWGSWGVLGGVGGSGPPTHGQSAAAHVVLLHPHGDGGSTGGLLAVLLALPCLCGGSDGAETPHLQTPSPKMPRNAPISPQNSSPRSSSCSAAISKVMGSPSRAWPEARGAWFVAEGAWPGEEGAELGASGFLQRRAGRRGITRSFGGGGAGLALVGVANVLATPPQSPIDQSQHAVDPPRHRPFIQNRPTAHAH